MFVNSVFKVSRYLLVTVTLSFFFSGLAYASHDPKVYFSTPYEELGVGSELVVYVFVESDKPLNVYDIEIGFSPKTLEFTYYNAGTSIVDFFAREPEILKEGILKMGGGSFKPFVGEAGELVKLNFRAKNEGLAQLSFRKADVHYADGKGTAVQAVREPITFQIVSDLPPTASDVEDNTPPALNMETTKDPLYDAELLVFNAQDKESGIRSTHVRLREGILWKDWQAISNPWRISSKAWAVQLKAVDNRGNVRESTLYLWDRLFGKMLYVLIAGAALFLGGYGYGRLKRRRHR